jgi:hypothetical protein
LDASVVWVVRLFRGENKDGNNEELTTNCVQFWKASRALLAHKKTRKMRKAHKQLVQSLKPWGDDDDGAGLLRRPNNNSSTTSTSAWGNKCRAIVRGVLVIAEEEKDPGVVPQQQTGLDLLAVLKQQATQGKLVDYTGLSYLGCALAKTLRVFPPIWPCHEPGP